VALARLDDISRGPALVFGHFQKEDSEMAKEDWSNDPKARLGLRPQQQQTVAQALDEEMKTPTPRERDLAAKAEDAKAVQPRRYDIKSKNAKALRVVYDHGGASVAIQPGESKLGVMLAPHIAEYLGRGDLEITVAA
jgi:hypothetical protein